MNIIGLFIHSIDDVFEFVYEKDETHQHEHAIFKSLYSISGEAKVNKYDILRVDDINIFIIIPNKRQQWVLK